MAKSFNKLRNTMSAKAQTKAGIKTQMLYEEIALQQIRQSLNISQASMAEKLLTKQANISRLERRSDMYISTLENYIAAMGGKLELIAQFPDGNIKIKLTARKND